MQFQRGQAMVEYAILFIVLSILFIGGAELGMAALASYKNTDAAKTGISEYAEVNQRRLNILNAEKQYLISLSGYGCGIIYQITNPFDDATATYLKSDGVSSSGYGRLELNSDEFELTCNNPSALNPPVPPSAEIVTEIIPNYLQVLDNYYISEGSIDGIQSSLLTLSARTGTSTTSINSPSEIIIALAGNDGNLSIEELVNGAADLEKSIVGAEVDPSQQFAEGQIKFRALLIIAHYKLSLLPLKTDNDNDGVPDIGLSNAALNIGNHASSNFSQPRCEGNEYIYGFPDNDSDGIEDRFILETQSGNEIYLFNPLPINIASCEGSDDTRGGRSRISILVGGYSDLTDPTKNEPGLPKLNQAMYGMYKNDLNGNLIPPGKICTSEDDCPNQPNESLYVDDVGPSGYYRWNKGSDGTGSGDLFQYTINNVSDDLQNGFRPSMQIDCSSTPNPEGQVSGINGNINDPNCQSDYSKVRVHTRYRKIFEGFLTFGLQKLNTPNDSLEAALDLFYNPNNVGVPGSNQVNGTIDSEIGPLVKEGGVQYPTVKRRKDFRGCYEVDVETNQISACN